MLFIAVERWVKSEPCIIQVSSKFFLSRIASERYGIFSGFGRPTVQSKRVKESDSSEGGNGNLNPCRYYLPFSGCSASLGSIGSLTLGFQIIGLMLVGFLFAIPSVLGVLWAFNNDHRKRRALWLSLSAICTPAWLFLYCWAFWGNPMGVLGLP